jgi:hypothetical protein
VNADGSGTIVDKTGKQYDVQVHEHLYHTDPRLKIEYRVVNEHGHIVASAELRREKTAVSSVFVHEQRKGIATALYKHIEKHLGYKLQPNAALTDEGAAFWKSRSMARLLLTAARNVGTLRSLGDLPGHEFHGNQWTEGRSSKELSEEFKELPKNYGSQNFQSDTATELTSPYRSTPERRAEYERIKAASNRDAALRTMDSEKQWGTNWAVAVDEWQAAQALGANDSVSRTTKDALKEAKSLSDDDLKAFKTRVSLLHAQLEKDHPSGQVELYRGIKGPQAKKLDLGAAELGVHGLSSWSTSRRTAEEFVGKSGRLLKTTASIKDVWATGDHVVANQVVRLTDQHGEYVLKTSGKSRPVHVVR